MKNERGLTPYDVAVRADYNTIVALFNEPKRDKKAAKQRPKQARKPSDSDNDGSDTPDSDLF